MNWLILTLLAVGSRATLSIALKLLSNRVKVSASTQAVLLTTGAGVLALFVSPFIGGLSLHGLGTLWFIVLLMVISQAFGNIIFFKALDKLDASTAQIAFSTILIWSTILAVTFLHSHFTSKQLLGIFILLIAILTVQYSRAKNRHLNEGLAYAIIAAGLYAVFQTTSADLAKTVSAGTYLLVAYLGSSLIVGGIYRKTLEKDFNLLKKRLPHAASATLFASAMSLLYFVFSYFAYKHAPDRGVVVVLLTSQVVLSVILAIIFLKERKNVGRKVAGGVLAVIAGILIKS